MSSWDVNRENKQTNKQTKVHILNVERPQCKQDITLKLQVRHSGLHKSVGGHWICKPED